MDAAALRELCEQHLTMEVRRFATKLFADGNAAGNCSHAHREWQNTIIDALTSSLQAGRPEPEGARVIGTCVHTKDANGDINSRFERAGEQAGRPEPPPQDTAALEKHLGEIWAELSFQSQAALMLRDRGLDPIIRALRSREGDRPPPPPLSEGPISHMVVRRRETDPVEVFPFTDEASARAFHDRAQQQWSDCYLVRVIRQGMQPPVTVEDCGSPADLCTAVCGRHLAQARRFPTD